jgi:Glycosyl hydrolase catalytic core
MPPSGPIERPTRPSASVRSPIVRTFSLAIALLTLTLAAASPASATTFGIGDQNPQLFSDSRWSELPLKDVRRVVEWDTQTDAVKTAGLDQWMAAAQSTGAIPLLAIDRSTTVGKEKKAPTVKQYSALITWLKGRYPFWSRLSPWNEANFRLQPTYKNPKLALDYYKAARKACKSCKITSPVILAAGAGTNSKWLPQFLKLGGKSIKLWAFHNYGDLNRRTDTTLKAFERQVKGDIWITEAAGWVIFDTGKWPRDPARAAKVVDFTFSVAKKHKRVKYVYFWQWLGTAGTDVRWDSGFFDADGTARPGYASLKKGLGR